MNTLSKKGEGMVLNIVIIAVILLVVLAVVLVIFFRGTSDFQRGTGCSDPARCVFAARDCAPGQIPTPMTCTGYAGMEGRYCCVGDG